MQSHIGTAFRRAIRIALLATHIAAGLCTISFLFPHCSHATQRRHILRWSGKLLHILGVHVRTHGSPMPTSEATLIVANHISWLDVFALNHVCPARFVAKSEVAHWPLIGRLCQGTGTLFIERGNKRDALRANKAIMEALQQGQHIALFPEGTSSDGSIVLPFRSPLLQPALDSRTPIQPVYLRYSDTNDQQSSAAAYCGDMTFRASLWRLLGNRHLNAELHYLDPIQISAEISRQELTQKIERLIRTTHSMVNQQPIDKP